MKDIWEKLNAVLPEQKTKPKKTRPKKCRAAVEPAVGLKVKILKPIEHAGRICEITKKSIVNSISYFNVASCSGAGKAIGWFKADEFEVLSD